MPRHIGGVRKRRSRKSRERATIAGIPGSAKAKAELFQRLRRAFESTPEVSETPERTRLRYIESTAWPITWHASGPTLYGSNVLTN
jgi:hypothetical protein